MVEKPSKKKQKDDRAGGSGRTNRRERVREEPQGLKALAEESRSIAALKALRHPKARFAKDCGLSQQAAGLQVAGLRQMPQPARRRIWAWCRLEMREMAATIMLDSSCMVATSRSSKAPGDEDSTSNTPSVRR